MCFSAPGNNPAERSRLRYEADFPHGIRRIPTSGEGYLCALHAIINSISRHPAGLLLPQVDELLSIHLETTHGEHAAALQIDNENLLSVDQLAVVLQRWGRQPAVGMELVLGVIKPETESGPLVPRLYFAPDDDNFTVVWVYFDDAANFCVSPFVEVVSHYEGVRARSAEDPDLDVVNDQDNESVVIPDSQDEYDGESVVIPDSDDEWDNEDIIIPDSDAELDDVQSDDDKTDTTAQKSAKDIRSVKEQLAEWEQQYAIPKTDADVQNFQKNLRKLVHRLSSWAKDASKDELRDWFAKGQNQKEMCNEARSGLLRHDPDEMADEVLKHIPLCAQQLFGNSKLKVLDLLALPDAETIGQPIVYIDVATLLASKDVVRQEHPTLPFRYSKTPVPGKATLPGIKMAKRGVDIASTAIEAMAYLGSTKVTNNT